MKRLGFSTSTIGSYGLFISGIPTRFRAISASFISFITLKLRFAFFARHSNRTATKSGVFMRVLTSANKFKVFYSIIASNVIYMVDCFIFTKFSMKKLFHNVSMFKKSFSVNRDRNISIFSFSPIRFPSPMVSPVISFYFTLINRIILCNTTTRTIFGSVFSIRKNLKFLFTKSTDCFISGFSHNGYCTLNYNGYQFI